MCIKVSGGCYNWFIIHSGITFRERRVLNCEMEPKEVTKMERLWTDRSKNGVMPSFQVAVLLPQIRKDFEVDEDALDELLTELDKEENGLVSKEIFEKVCQHFLTAK